MAKPVDSGNCSKPEIAASEQVTAWLSRRAVTCHGRFLGTRAWKAVEGRVLKLKRALQKTAL